MSISRREFLEVAAAGAVATTVDAKTGMPTRILGRTGARVSILAFGGGSRFLAYKTDQDAIAALNRALDQGITYIDTAASYGDGLSQQRIGQVMKTRRNQVFLASKVHARKGDEAMRLIEASLQRLQTDHLDLLHIHHLLDDQDLAAIEAEDGVLKVLYKMREQKVARAIGITCHGYADVLKTALERHDFDATQMALNAARMGMEKPREGKEIGNPLANSFETLALPVALRKKMGVTAMKVFAQERLLGKTAVENLVRYTMSLPIATAVVGMPKLEHIDANIRIAKSFRPMPAPEMRDLSRKLAATGKASLGPWFTHHVDA